MNPESDQLEFPIERDRETGTYRTQSTWNDGRPPSAVVVGLLEAAGVGPAAADPLWNHVDPEALDGLFAPKIDGRPRPAGHVSFRYADFEVTVEDDGEVTLAPVDGCE